VVERPDRLGRPSICQQGPWELQLGTWLVIPLAVLAFKLGGWLVLQPPRYLSFLYPAAILVLAFAIEALIISVLHLGHPTRSISNRMNSSFRDASHRPFRLPLVRPALIVVITGVVLVQVVPALAVSYAQPKDDYRGLVQYVVRHSAPDSVVLALGVYRDFGVIGLSYYMDQYHSPIPVVNGEELDGRVGDKLLRGRGSVWGAFVWPSADEERLLTSAVSNQEVTVKHFLNLILVKWNGKDSASPISSAEALLKWASPTEPSLLSSVELLSLIQGHGQVGPDILPGPSSASQTFVNNRWYLNSGSKVNGGTVFVLSPGGHEADATYTATPVGVTDVYLISFEYRNGALGGSQHVFVTIQDSKGQWLQIFPNGAGYLCSHASSWSHGIFAFTVPKGAASMSIWLRANGSGQAAFQSVTLDRIVKAA